MSMQTVKYVYWQEEDAWLGYLQDYPDYWTQGETLEDLLEHLKDLYLDVTSGQLPGIRKVGELVIP
jgi:predicted RNase H-like HicB family nuclease